MIEQNVDSQTLLEQYQTLFDTLEKQPLTLKQRQACISPAQNTLVLAGAGTGKTSTLIGRVAYLIQSQQAQADEILMLAFAVEAADEMQERGEFLLDSKFAAVSQGHVDQGRVLHGQVDQGEVLHGHVDQGEVLHGHVDQDRGSHGQVDQGGVSQGQVRQGEVMQAEGVSVNSPNRSHGFTARTFHSLGFHILQSVQNQARSQAQIQVLDQARGEALKQTPLTQAQSSVSQLTATRLKLTPLTEEERLQAFMQTSFQALLQQEDCLYAQVLQDYYTFYSDEIAQGIWRSLADEYVLNGLELMLANTLYQNHIAYQYQAHFAYDINLSPYKPYRATFFLPACNLYMNVFNCTETDLDKPQEKSAWAYRERREQVRRIHSKHGIQALEIYQDKILNGLSGELIAKAAINSEQSLDEHSELNLITAQASNVEDSKSYKAELCVQHPPSCSVELKCLQVMQALVLAQLKTWPRQAFANPVMRSQGRTDALVHLLSDVLLTLHAQGADGLQLRQALSCELQILVDLLLPLYERYLDALSNESAIDFEQMIQYATDAVRTGAYKVTWRDILIDEFQDISQSRFALIQAIREQKPDIRIFCVGDDWQSIYQFAGSQVRYTRNFEDYFGASQRYTLDKTFRFHQALCDLSTRFIQANPSQTRKDLKSFQTENKVGLSLVNDEISIESILEQIVLIRADERELDKLPEPCRCLVLARFSHLLPAAKELSRWHSLFPCLQIKCSTIHAAKGKEADYVIVLGNQAGQFGLPSDKQSHPLIQSIRQDDEDYPYAQERRVFYVAITRARQHVYLLYSAKKPSVFIQELQAGGYAYLSDLQAPRKKRFLQLGSVQKTHLTRAHQLWPRMLKTAAEWVRGN